MLPLTPCSARGTRKASFPSENNRSFLGMFFCFAEIALQEFVCVLNFGVVVVCGQFLWDGGGIFGVWGALCEWYGRFGGIGKRNEGYVGLW
jgi:hypothetical protein